MTRPEKQLDSLLVKPAGPDCNMDCGYCFYLEKADLWPGQKQHRMTDDLLEIMIRQAMSAAAAQVSFGWQGGEPTLMGLPFFEKAVDLQKRYGRGRIVGNGLQTNGLLIDASWAAFLARYDFLVGLSLDGPEHIHDRYRVSRNGKGTWKKVVDCAKRLLDAGVAVNALVVLNDYSVEHPEEIYSFLKDLGLNHMQFIPMVEDQRSAAKSRRFSLSADKYGAFLNKVFDLWWADLDGLTPATSIRYFDSLLFRYVGMIPPECTLLETCGIYLVVEHNGDVYACDFFVSPECKLGNIRHDRLEEMLNSERQNAFGCIKSSLPQACLSCKWLTECAGGCPKDRIASADADEAPLNRYCEAFQAFLAHADERMKKLARDWKAQQEALENEERIVRMQSRDRSRQVPAAFTPGRNDPCPCGSGLKYKRCCGR